LQRAQSVKRAIHSGHVLAEDESSVGGEVQAIRHGGTVPFVR